MTNAIAIADETVPSLPELWRVRTSRGEVFELSSWEAAQLKQTETPADALLSAIELRCPDCGMWFSAASEKRGRAAVDRHRSGEECRTKWTYRQLLWEGKAPLTAGGARVRDEFRAAMGAELGPGSFSRGSRGRRSSVGTRDWASYARILKWESIKGDKSVTIEAVQNCAEFERIATERTRALALQPWSTAEEIRIALSKA